MIVNLPWKDRKVISDVAKVYCDLAIRGDGYDDRIRQFWRISMYIKAGILYKRDLQTILTAMEVFYEKYQKGPAWKDPDGDFKGLGETIPKLRAIAYKHALVPQP